MADHHHQKKRQDKIPIVAVALSEMQRYPKRKEEKSNQRYVADVFCVGLQETYYNRKSRTFKKRQYKSNFLKSYLTSLTQYYSLSLSLSQSLIILSFGML